MKTILFCHDTYYERCPDGDIFAHGAFPYRLWEERFLPHCENLHVIGRYKDTAALAAHEQSNGPRVTHTLLSNINTPLKRLRYAKNTYKRIYAAVAQADGIIIRGPAEFGMMAAKAARKLGKPYAIEMSGCAFDHTWHHGSLIGKLYAPIKYIRARHMVAHADQVIYVTQNFLQARYPNKNLTACASNVDITLPLRITLDKRITQIQSQDAPMQIGMIGNYGNHLKGLDVALKTLIHLRQSNISCKLHILGSGNPQKWTRYLTKHNLTQNVQFHAPLPSGASVMQWLDQMDIYIQPSRHEGLPRALIEAMSRGLPCLASNAGGTAELLKPDCIHTAGNAKQLTKQIATIWHDKNWQCTQSKCNAKTAANYTSDKLTPIRHRFWQTFANHN